MAPFYLKLTVSVRNLSGNKETVGTELHILTHQVGIHADEGNREGLSDAIAFDGDSISWTIVRMRLGEAGYKSLVWRRHANSQWSPSSRLMSSLAKQKPGMRPHSGVKGHNTRLHMKQGSLFG